MRGKLNTHSTGAAFQMGSGRFVWGHWQEYKFEKNAILQQERLFIRKKEALLRITTLPCLKVLSYWTRKTNQKVRGTVKSLPKVVSKRSHQEECVPSAKTAKRVASCVASQALQVTDNFFQASPARQSSLRSKDIDLQNTLSSRWQLESSAGKPFTSS